MGNHKFRLSDMIPNAWFYKLKDMSKRTNSSSTASASTAPHYSHHQHHHHTKKKKQQRQQPIMADKPPQKPSSRKSYYITRDSTPARSVSHSKSSSVDSLFPDPVQSKQGAPPPPTPSDVEEPSLLPEMRSDRALPTESNVSWSSTCNYEPRNIVIDLDETKQLAAKIENCDDFVTIFDLELRPIITKPNKTNKPKHKNQELHSGSNKRSPGMKLRVNSPRIASKRFQAATNSRRSLSSSSSSTSSKNTKNKSALAESLAIVKRSSNPQEDFKQSMVEMIVEHEIRSSEDLEELLACYLSLNSDEYHDLIITVFKQIWFQLSGLHNNKNNFTS